MSVEGVLKAMSAYCSEEEGFPVTITSYEELTLTLCDSGCWEEVRVFMTGTDKENLYYSYEYSGELSELIRDLSHFDYLHVNGRSNPALNW